MEKKIGEKFVCEVYGELEVVEVKNYIGDCELCVFLKDDCQQLINNGILSECFYDMRSDNKDVYFVKECD